MDRTQNLVIVVIQALYRTNSIFCRFALMGEHGLVRQTTWSFMYRRVPEDRQLGKTLWCRLVQKRRLQCSILLNGECRPAPRGSRSPRRRNSSSAHRRSHYCKVVGKAPREGVHVTLLAASEVADRCRDCMPRDFRTSRSSHGDIVRPNVPISPHKRACVYRMRIPESSASDRPVICKLLKEWWPETGSNRRRRPFQGRALPLSYLALA